MSKSEVRNALLSRIGEFGLCPQALGGFKQLGEVPSAAMWRWVGGIRPEQDNEFKGSDKHVTQKQHGGAEGVALALDGS